MIDGGIKGDEEERIIEIKEEHLERFKRLDQCLANEIQDISRTFLKKLYEKGLVTASDSKGNQVKIELKKMPPVGTTIALLIPPPAPIDAIPQDIPIEILYEDEHLIVVNKHAGLVVHPAPGHPDQTLVNAVLFHCPDLAGIGEKKRPGIVHRLDKGTSGVMVVAKSQKAHEGLVLLFSTHTIKRQYCALVAKAGLAVGGTLQSNLGRHPNNRLKMAAKVKQGKRAVTHYKVLQEFHKISLVQLTLETGRTHQIRVHLSQLLHAAVLNDPLYGRPSDHLARVPSSVKELVKEYEHPFLHAKLLGFKHPVTGEDLLLEAPPPPLFQKVLAACEKEES
jgi:23S rRNA pseudouridine1911/1915/1917 synthase